MTKSEHEQAAREYSWKDVKQFLEQSSEERSRHDYDDPIIAAFLAGCEHEAKRDKWVSVKERLPEDRIEVLGIIDDVIHAVIYLAVATIAYIVIYEPF